MTLHERPRVAPTTVAAAATHPRSAAVARTATRRSRLLCLTLALLALLCIATLLPTAHCQSQTPGGGEPPSQTPGGGEPPTTGGGGGNTPIGGGEAPPATTNPSKPNRDNPDSAGGPTAREDAFPVWAIIVTAAAGSLLLLYVVLKCQNPRATHFDAIIFFLALLDFGSDCWFVYTLRDNISFETVYILAIAFTAVPFVINFCSLMYIIWTEMGNLAFRRWLNHNFAPFTAVTLVSCTNIDSMFLLDSHVCGLPCFAAPWSEHMRALIRMFGLITIIFEDIPQAALQIYVISSSNYQLVNIIALCSSLINIFFGTTKRALVCCVYQYDKRGDIEDPVLNPPIHAGSFAAPVKHLTLKQQAADGGQATAVAMANFKEGTPRGGLGAAKVLNPVEPVWTAAAQAGYGKSSGDLARMASSFQYEKAALSPAHRAYPPPVGGFEQQPAVPLYSGLPPANTPEGIPAPSATDGNTAGETHVGYALSYESDSSRSGREPGEAPASGRPAHGEAHRRAQTPDSTRRRAPTPEVPDSPARGQPAVSVGTLRVHSDSPRSGTPLGHAFASPVASARGLSSRALTSARAGDARDAQLAVPASGRASTPQMTTLPSAMPLSPRPAIPPRPASAHLSPRNLTPRGSFHTLPSSHATPSYFSPQLPRRQLAANGVSMDPIPSPCVLSSRPPVFTVSAKDSLETTTFQTSQSQLYKPIASTEGEGKTLGALMKPHA